MYKCTQVTKNILFKNVGGKLDLKCIRHNKDLFKQEGKRNSLTFLGRIVCVLNI